MEINATFIVAFVSFIVFTVIMNLILYKPLNRVVVERQRFIDDYYEGAKSDRKNSERILRDKAKKLETTKHEARKLITVKTNNIKSQKASMTIKAQQSASIKIEEAKEKLTEAKHEAQEVLSNEVINLAQRISSKILDKHIAIQNVDKASIIKSIKGNE